jgi:hypothetical protein
MPNKALKLAHFVRWDKNTMRLRYFRIVLLPLSLVLYAIGQNNFLTSR